MHRRIRIAGIVIALMIINVLVGRLCEAAFLSFISKGDIATTTVLAMLALPGIIAQPWFVFLFFLPHGPVLAPLLTTAITVPLYLLLDHKRKLDGLKHILRGIKRGKGAILVGSTGLCLLAIVFARRVDFPALHAGTPATLSQRISPDLAVGNCRYYCLGSFVDAAWLWRATIPKEDMRLLAKQLNMNAIPATNVGVAYRHMPPYWWRPVISSQTTAWATTNFPVECRGPDGWHALATWNPDNNVVHLWIKDNF